LDLFGLLSILDFFKFVPNILVGHKYPAVDSRPSRALLTQPVKIPSSEKVFSTFRYYNLVQNCQTFA
jgi:hypothetical protein